MAKMFLITAEETKVVKASELEDYYRLIGCDCIDIVARKIGDKYFEIICDDEGLLKENPRISAIDKNKMKPALVGNLLIAGPTDEDGELTSLTDKDIELIKNNLLSALAADRITNILEIEE